MVTLSTSSQPAINDLPAPIAAYIGASNRFDLDAVMANFAESSLVNEQHCEYIGLPAIRYWVAREIIGDRVTMEVATTAIRGDNVAVVANIDGEYDKSGLPSPLTLTFYFSVSGDRIEQLIILRNKATRRTGFGLDDPLKTYFAAKDLRDVDAMLACFAEDAVVVDEAQERRGHSMIREWIERSTQKYQVSVDVTDSGERDGKTVVTALLSGNFPGSPAKLHYAFSLSNAKVMSLEIS
jgi:ketosteroid isomerase-like protein